ncbi:LVIVD repeat-containing protein [Flavobacterium sp. I3-2]|uniref:LVIVD repeat-containing protein n=1 Tax=Flavobacterium sp. I3-2 TaxID=2748319 RepID=UPI0015A763B6|nr:hypothetical protein [Flavobacterium sp. I3-2]
MKKITLTLMCIFFVLLTISCSSDNSGNQESEGSSQSDGKGGSLATFALKGNYLYTVDYQKLNVFNIQNKENPVKVNQKDVGFNIETLYSLDNYLFIGSRNGMFIYDVTNPENPNLLSEAQHFTACDPVVANQTHAFVTLHSNTNCGNNLNTLMVYDIADPRNPELIHQRNLTFPRGLALHDNYLIVCDDELKIFNITNPAEPILAKSFNTNFKDVVVYNDVLFAFGDKSVSQYKWTGNDFLTLEQISSFSY